MRKGLSWGRVFAGLGMSALLLANSESYAFVPSGASLEDSYPLNQLNIPSIGDPQWVVITQGSHSVSGSQLGAFEKAQNTKKLLSTIVYLEGRNLNILVGKHEQQICLLPGESYTLPRKPKEPGEISLTDKGECGQ